MLFQAQFRGPETDAFFADMSQFTGSKSVCPASVESPAKSARVSSKTVQQECQKECVARASVEQRVFKQESPESVFKKEG